MKLNFASLNNDDEFINFSLVPKVIENYDSESNSSWPQIGGDINGEADGDHSGYSIAMNSSGTRIAVGSPLYNEGVGVDMPDFVNRGQVKVYDWNGSSWTQVGSDILGEESNDNSGHSVAMNSSGTRIVIGAPYSGERSRNGVEEGYVRVYDWDGSSSSWTKVGDINDTKSHQSEHQGWFGYSVAMSGDGDTIVVGAPRYSTLYNAIMDEWWYQSQDLGQVLVYRRDINEDLGWTKIGEITPDKTKQRTGMRFGWSVTINNDGSRIAASMGNHFNYDGPKYVYMYEYNNSQSSWDQLGGGIDPIGSSATEDRGCFGWSIHMNADGDKIVIGQPDINPANFSPQCSRCDLDYQTYAFPQRSNILDATSVIRPGSVYIYEYSKSESSWKQVGQTIDGSVSNGRAGYSVRMKDDSNGTRVIFGSPAANDNKGLIQVYDWNGTSWVKLGNNVYGSAADDESGHSVAMDKDGTRIAIGAPKNDDGNGYNSGQVRVFEFNNTPTEEATLTEEATPTEETIPTEEITPTEETTPTEENTPAEEATPAEEITPAEETTPTEEATPAEEIIPTEEATPAEESIAQEDNETESGGGGISTTYILGILLLVLIFFYLKKNKLI